MDLVGEQNDLLLRLMSASALRAKTIAGNLSNQTTPGYTRRVVRFEDLLSREIGAGHASRRHLARLEPQVELDHASPRAADGNNVSLEVEMNALRETQVMYDLYAAMLSVGFKSIELALGRGR